MALCLHVRWHVSDHSVPRRRLGLTPGVTLPPIYPAIQSILLLAGTSGREGTDRYVVAIRIPKSELHRCGARVPVRLLLEPGYQRARPQQRLVEIINPEEQQQAVARGWVGSGQRGMPMVPH